MTSGEVRLRVGQTVACLPAHHRPSLCRFRVQCSGGTGKLVCPWPVASRTIFRPTDPHVEHPLRRMGPHTPACCRAPMRRPPDQRIILHRNPGLAAIAHGAVPHVEPPPPPLGHVTAVYRSSRNASRPPASAPSMSVSRRFGKPKRVAPCRHVPPTVPIRQPSRPKRQPVQLRPDQHRQPIRDPLRQELDRRPPVDVHVRPQVEKRVRRDRPHERRTDPAAHRRPQPFLRERDEAHPRRPVEQVQRERHARAQDRRVDREVDEQHVPPIRPEPRHERRRSPAPS